MFPPQQFNSAGVVISSHLSIKHFKITYNKHMTHKFGKTMMVGETRANDRYTRKQAANLRIYTLIGFFGGFCGLLYIFFVWVFLFYVHGAINTYI